MKTIVTLPGDFELSINTIPLGGSDSELPDTTVHLMRRRSDDVPAESKNKLKKRLPADGHCADWLWEGRIGGPLPELGHFDDYYHQWSGHDDDDTTSDNA